MASVYAAVSPTQHERALAELSIELLREHGVSEAEILLDYTKSSPQADRAYETQYYRENHVRVSATRIKWQMRRMLTR